MTKNSNLVTESVTKTPSDATITLAEFNLLRRIRQVKRQKLAEGILVNFVTGELRLVGKAEQFDCVNSTLETAT